MSTVTYLDHAATTPLRPEVAAAMAEVHAVPGGVVLGNPTGSHPPAQRARRLLEEARDEVAAFLGRDPGDIVFTSGGTESANLAVLGPAEAARREKGEAVVLCSAVEHPAVRESARAAAKAGVDVRELPVDSHGIVEPDALARALSSRVTVVAVMTANNETGVVQPLHEIIDAVRRRAPNAVVFTDAVQAALSLNLAEATAGADLVSVSAHKVGGPVGVGALAVNGRVVLEPRQYGGGQERERRSGTQDVAGAIGLATALRLVSAERAAAVPRMEALRDRLADGLLGVARGSPPHRAAGRARGRGPPGPPAPVRAGGRAGGAAGRARTRRRLHLRRVVVCQRRPAAEPRPRRHGRGPRTGGGCSPLHAGLWHHGCRHRPRPRRRAGHRRRTAPTGLIPGGTLDPMRVLVAMSGGVDSSVAAALLVEQGHEVVGATLKLWGGPSDSGCCSVADVEDARRVAQQLGITHHVFNLTEEFDRNVVAPYVGEHARGRTPNPCIECNRTMKFDRLLERADRLGFHRLATGHHARVGHPGPDASSLSLRRGADPAKDQSYVLSMLGQDALSRVLFPVGEMTKDDVRAHARRLGLRTAAKPDSQDVCFIGSAEGREGFLSRRVELHPAEMVDGDGRPAGSVEAVELVTVGQRRGMGHGSDGKRRYVTHVDVAARRVTVGSAAEALRSSVVLAGPSLTWVDQPLAPGSRAVAQVSAHGRPVPCTLVQQPGDAALAIHFDDPQRPVAPGQTVALYDELDPDAVVGAGIAA